MVTWVPLVATAWGAYFVWTALEYAIHRGLHACAPRVKQLYDDPMAFPLTPLGLHRRHHARPVDQTGSGAVATLFAIATIAVPYLFNFSIHVKVFLLSFVVFAARYYFLHCLLHTRTGWRMFPAACHVHRAHHIMETYTGYFGVTTPLWDIVCQTPSMKLPHAGYLALACVPGVDTFVYGCLLDDQEENPA